MVKLSELAPTAEEIAQARAALAALDARGKKSKMSSMAFFLKNSPESALEKGTRGERRKEYLELWMVHSSRGKQAKLALANSTSVTQEVQKQQNMCWRGKHKMQLEMGPAKAQAWIDSGRVGERPDSMANEKGEWLTEYGVPQEWAGKQWSAKTTATLSAKTAGDGDKAKIMEELAHEVEDDITAKALGVSAKDDPKVKAEPKEEQTEDERMIQSVQRDPKSWLRLHQDMRLQLMEVIARTEGKKFMDNLLDECNKLLPKVKSLVTIFEAMLSKKPDDKWLPTLCKKIRSASDTYDDIIDHAVRLAIISKKPKTTKKAS